jgi:hypothetical protein
MNPLDKLKKFREREGQDPNIKPLAKLKKSLAKLKRSLEGQDPNDTQR